MDMQALWDYQQADLALEKFQKELKDTPTRKRLVQLQRFLQASQGKVGELENAAVVRQNDISELEAQYSELVKDLEDAGKDLSYYSECSDEELDGKDIEEMVKNCERVNEALSQVKKKLTGIRQEIADTDRQVKELFAKMKAAKTEYDSLREEHKKEIEGGSDDVAGLENKKAEIEKNVPEEFLSEYKRIKGFRSNPVAVLDNNRCGGCNMQLPANVTGKVAASAGPVTCENCGRILILP